MAQNGHFRAGKGSRITANGVNLLKTEWDTTDHGDDLDTTNFETSGLEQGTIGIEGVDFSAKGNWNAQTNEYDSPPGIFPQDSFPNLKLYENLADNVFWNFPFSRILQVQNGATVKGLVTLGWNGKAQPGWSRPTGNV